MSQANCIELPAHIGGFFKFEAVKIDAEGNESRRVLADWFPNLITDVGLEAMGTVSIANLTSYCRVGTSSTTPAFTDTALNAQIASTATINSQVTGAQSTSPYYSYVRQVYRFGAGVAAGNLSEVGMGSTAASATLFSHALILDGGGSPTTITVLSDEYLDVTYEVRCYMDIFADVPYSITISGVTYSGVMRRANVTNFSNFTAYVPGGDNNTNTVIAYNGSIGAVTTVPSGSTDGISTSNLAYTGSSKYRDFTGTFDLSHGNLSGGISALSIRTTQGYYQFSVSPVIPKTATQILTLTFRCGPWARYP